MYQRWLKRPIDSQRSFFLLGPRATGKSSWLTHFFQHAITIDLLLDEDYQALLANPSRLVHWVDGSKPGQWVIIDEIQKIPALLNEVHRLIERRGLRFALTGSSARSLRKQGVNLLAGRALEFHMHPLCAGEIGRAFDLGHALQFGMLPDAWKSNDPGHYLKSYVNQYIRQEVMMEGLTRKLDAFSRFLECASFSQGSVINASSIAREVQCERKLVTAYFSILEDLMVGAMLPAFQRRAKRRVTISPKFYFFDAGVFQALRPRGILDRPEEIAGATLETLVWQHLRAVLEYAGVDDQLYFWRTSNGLEVDFVLYGSNRLVGIEVKHNRHDGNVKLTGLKAFQQDYPMAKLMVLYMGSKELCRDGVYFIPVELFLKDPLHYLSG